MYLWVVWFFYTWSFFLSLNKISRLLVVKSRKSLFKAQEFTENVKPLLAINLFTNKKL